MASSFYENLQQHENDEKIDTQSYTNMIGSLQFLSLKTRPDISLTVGILSQFCHKQTKFLNNCVKRILGYLKGTRDFGLRFEQTTVY